ncbi:MAG: hypothetical protein COA78_10910 [Blastopirellula sp.]|nr:MAG: hypothetical protein COA78_10910 [Blastopirellula sp.]
MQAYYDLDKFALLARQDYNCGNTGKWFSSFRGGLYGSYARIIGVTTHYYDVHSWIPRPRLPSETECHLASLYFNIDSAVECITYALNALGYCATAGSKFHDVTDARKLRQIAPHNIIGRDNRLLPEYSQIFPDLSAYWVSKKDLLETLFEQHDVSKHRKSIYTGGLHRTDPPPGFYESLGIAEDDANLRALYWPMKEILIRNDPKTPEVDRTSIPVSEQVLLEDLVVEYKEFIEESGKKILSDAKSSIVLNHTQFKS